MCRCTPEIRTPFCGKWGCEAPASKPITVEVGQAATRRSHITTRCGACGAWVTVEFEPSHRAMALHAAAAAAGLHEAVCGGRIETVEGAP